MSSTSWRYSGLLPIDELSRSVRAQDDLWAFVNDTWLRGDPIPSDRARWGLSDEKRARISEQLHELVAIADRGASRPEEQLVARLHAAYLDLGGRARAAITPIGDELTAIEAATDTASLLYAMGERQREGVPGFAAVSLQPDAAEPTRWAVHLFQGGLTLGSPAPYGRLGAALAQTARTMVVEAGLPEAVATRAMSLERALADVSWSRPYGDDDRSTTNPMTWQELTGLLGTDPIPWFAGLGLDEATRAPLNVCQPSFWAGFGGLLASRATADWQAWLTWRVLWHRAPLLTPALEEHHHAFTLRRTGQAEPTPRWRRAVDVVGDHAGTALGRLYVERHVDVRAKQVTETLAERVREALRRRLQRCAWLSEQSRTTAALKLDRIHLNIGWPDTWPPTPGLPAGGPDHPVTLTRWLAAAASGSLAQRLDQPVDRSLWGPPPFVVNTFYHPLLNQLTVEGGSLPPVEVLDDAAVLHGQYASIIGHELGHAFDSRGSHRDPDGVAREWWTAAERAAFDERAARVVAQVDGYRPRGVDEGEVDGQLVGFEVIAELIGYQAAWDAYVEATTSDQRASVVDGFTGAQRFFLAKAYGRRAADRPDAARARLEADVHPPFELFADLARNLDGFHHAFGTEPGDGMWLAPEDRIRIF